MNKDPLETRIIELEKRVAFLDNHVEELNEAVNAQKKIIDKLQEKLKMINSQLSGESLVRPIEEEDRPPHY